VKPAKEEGWMAPTQSDLMPLTAEVESPERPSGVKPAQAEKSFPMQVEVKPAVAWLFILLVWSLVIPKQPPPKKGENCATWSEEKPEKEEGGMDCMQSELMLLTLEVLRLATPSVGKPSQAAESFSRQPEVKPEKEEGLRSLVWLLVMP